MIMIVHNLSPVLQAKGITMPYAFLLQTGLSRHTVTNMLNDHSRVFSFDHIEMLSCILVCQPADIVKWIP